uniref:Uncharacterized protein n=1 Tax=Tanacetum cinerariifolium TaxID=118510 RepID=A0A6L2NNK7_TANCI|nr:hypothetical protein [Tanacetum cinerariifolium]
MAAAGTCEEIEKVNVNYTLIENLQQPSTSGTQTDKAPVYASDRSAENDGNVILAESSMDPSGETVEQHPATVEEPHAFLSHYIIIWSWKLRKQTRSTSKNVIYVNNGSFTVHQEAQKILKDEIAPIVNQVDARVINFKKQFLKESTKFVRDFISLAKEADESLDNITVLEKANKSLLRVVVSQDIMSVVQNQSVVDTSYLQIKLDCTKEKLETCIIKKEKEYVVH